MAWRNLFRWKRRTFITGFSVAFGVFLAVTFTGSGDYSYTDLINTSATMGFGHVAIEPAGYNDTPSLSKWLDNAEDLRMLAQKVDGVDAAYSRISGQAMFARGAKNVGGIFFGIDPNVESQEHNLFLRAIEEGELFQDIHGRGVVVGVKMADKLKLKLGKKMIYTITDKNGEIVSEVGRVSGFFKTGDDAVDSSVALLPIARLRNVLGYGAQGASYVTIFIHDQRRADPMAKTLTSALGPGEQEILTWKETQADLAGLIAIDRAGNYILQVLVGILIAAGIFNTMFMSVLERTREFGVMMAIGMTPGQVIRLIMLESVWIGLFGLIFGIVLTTPWYLYMSTTGIDFTNLVGDDYSAGGVLVDPIFKLRLFKESAIAILLGVFGLTLLAGMYPAWRAGRIPPVESLKVL